ncbi:ribonuclease P protein component [Spongiimicrobium salis]|uniref:ribonuclease P protein component n=1 Tax=Spongiimicrobium salis TaxID=1667022 RepID=UPI00374CB836
MKKEDHTFPKEEKLKSRKLIGKLFEEGKSISKYPLKLIYLETKLPEGISIQAGVTVPKRKFKKAVDRNRIKRLLRESYRLQKPLLFNNIEGNFAFLFLYLGKDIPPYEKVERNMIDILQKFIIQINDGKNS